MCSYGLINRRSIRALDAPDVGAQSLSPLIIGAAPKLQRGFLRLYPRGWMTHWAAQVW